MVILDLDRATDFCPEDQLRYTLYQMCCPPESTLGEVWLLCLDTSREYYVDYLLGVGPVLNSTPIYWDNAVHAIRLDGVITPLPKETLVAHLIAETEGAKHDIRGTKPSDWIF